MGGDGTGSVDVKFGNQSGYNDLSSLFGGNRVFNLGAGSSSFDINTNSIDLSSFLKDSSTRTGGTGGEGGGFDVAASVGVGVGGGSGSGGSVDKASYDSSTRTTSVGVGNSDKMPLYIALGVVGIGAVLIIMGRKRRK